MRPFTRLRARLTSTDDVEDGSLGGGFPPTALSFHFALFCQPRGT